MDVIVTAEFYKYGLKALPLALDTLTSIISFFHFIGEWTLRIYQNDVQNFLLITQSPNNMFFKSKSTKNINNIRNSPVRFIVGSSLACFDILLCQPSKICKYL